MGVLLTIVSRRYSEPWLDRCNWKLQIAAGSGEHSAGERSEARKRVAACVSQIQAEIERNKLDRKLKSLIDRYKVKA